MNGLQIDYEMLMKDQDYIDGMIDIYKILEYDTYSMYKEENLSDYEIVSILVQECMREPFKVEQISTIFTLLSEQ